MTYETFAKMPDGDPERQSSPLDALHVLRRRWPTLAVVLFLTVAGSIGIDLHAQPRYQASSSVYLNPVSLVSQVSGGAMAATDAASLARTAQTQATIAQSPQIGALALRQGGIHGLDVKEALKETSVTPETNADLLSFSVTDTEPARAMRLANAYADAYTSAALKLAISPLTLAISRLRRSIASLGTNGQDNRALYATLVGKEEQLQSLSSLETSGSSVVQRPIVAGRVSPKRTENTLLAIVIGLILGGVLMWLHESLDTRLRTEAELDEVIGMPLLGKLSRPTGMPGGSLVALSQPNGPKAEEFRLLRANLDLAAITSPGATAFMFSSAEPAEGKSTTIANLGVTLARLGKRTLIVDLDLRRPRQAALFHVTGHKGLTDVIRGTTTLDEAIISIESSLPVHDSDDDQSAKAARPVYLLDTGAVPFSVGDFLVLPEVNELLMGLARSGDYDYVLVDTPPMLPFADARSVMNSVDALVAIARLGVLTRPAADELRQAAAAASVPCLGYVLTGAPEGRGIYGYGYAYRDDAAAQSRALRRERASGAEIAQD